MREKGRINGAKSRPVGTVNKKMSLFSATRKDSPVPGHIIVIAGRKMEYWRKLPFQFLVCRKGELRNEPSPLPPQRKCRRVPSQVATTQHIPHCIQFSPENGPSKCQFLPIKLLMISTQKTMI
jgi:hypothetical protein